MAKLWQIPSALFLVALSGCMARSPGLNVGDMMPDFAVASTKDPIMKIDSQSYRGRPILIDFWATWCPPCREELPHIQKIWSENRDRGLVVIPVTTDDLNTVMQFRSEQNVDMPTYLDADNKMSRAFGISGLPTTLVISRDGKVLYSSIGYSSDSDAELDAAIAQALL